MSSYPFTHDNIVHSCGVQKESKDFLNKKLKYCHDEIEQLKQANSEWETNYSQLQEQRESDLENLHEEYNETIAALKVRISHTFSFLRR